MIIDLKPWQKSLVRDLLDALPESVRLPLEKSVRQMTYIEKQTGDGFYRDRVVYISRGIRHPRLMAERTCHEWGHGIDEWMADKGFRIAPYSPEGVADGFALSILYPDLLDREEWKPISRMLRDVFYAAGFPDVGTERLIHKYSKIVKNLTHQSGKALGSEVHRRLEDFFRAQSGGFLRRGPDR